MTKNEIKIKLLKSQRRRFRDLALISKGLCALEENDLGTAENSIPPDDDPPEPPSGDDDDH